MKGAGGRRGKGVRGCQTKELKLFSVAIKIPPKDFKQE